MWIETIGTVLLLVVGQPRTQSHVDRDHWYFIGTVSGDLDLDFGYIYLSSHTAIIRSRHAVIMIFPTIITRFCRGLEIE